MSVRTDLAALLQTDWAGIPALAGVRVIATERALDDVQTPTALIRMDTVQRLTESPLSHRRVGLKFTLISPHLDLDRAADQLETLTDAALDYLGPRFQYGTASTVEFEQYLAVDIPLTIIASKD